MANKHKVKNTHHVVVLDMSSDTSKILDVVLTGLNAQFDGIRRHGKQHDEPQTITFITFNDDCNIVFSGLPSSQIKTINLSSCVAEGKAALNDAIVFAVEHIERIATDGSLVLMTVIAGDMDSVRVSKHTATDVAAKLESSQQQGWTVMYAGTRLSDAESFGIPAGNTLQYTPDHVGTSIAMLALSSARNRYLQDKRTATHSQLVSTTGKALDLTFPVSTVKTSEQIFAVPIERHGS